MQRIFVVLVMVLSLGLVPMASQAQTQTTFSEVLLEELLGIEAFVSELRGLEIIAPLARVFPSREQVSEFLITSIEEQLTPEDVERYMGFYVAFDLLPADLDLVGVYLALLEEQVGGYYDPESKTMNTILLSGRELGDSLPLLEQIVYAHEFVHALQDQHFDLQSIGLSVDTRDEYGIDELLAIISLIEGDATYVMNAYTVELQNRNPLAALQILGASLGSTGIPAGTPEILIRELTFPYNQGMVFVTALIREGGWERVDEAFTTDLPRSTEHILHPQKYLAGEQPIPVTLVASDGALGGEWRLVMEETLGEYYLREYLRTQLSSEIYRSAAEGWGGDRYRVYRDNAGDVALLLRLVWDTPADADEFVLAYAQFAGARNGVEADAAGCWVGADDVLCMVQVAADDVLISRAPTAEGALALLATQR